jgi:hypothetical protein
MIVIFNANLTPEFGTPTNNYTSFSKNNFYGNDRNRPALNIPDSPPGPGPSANCGVLNLGDVVAAGLGLPLPTLTLRAGESFWGSAHGPAPTGVGDAVGGVCDQNGGVTIATPFATTARPITSLP